MFLNLKNRNLKKVNLKFIEIIYFSGKHYTLISNNYLVDLIRLPHER